MSYIIAFLLIIVPIVAVHELGHWAAARFFGVRVLRFSVGFGKPLFIYKDKAGTEWALAPWPFGGYVRMFDAAAREQGAQGDPETALESKSPGRRIVIYAAGPLANFALAFVLLFGLLSAGVEGVRPMAARVLPDSAAAAAGLQSGDEIAAINGKETPLWAQAAAAIVDGAAAGEEMQLAVRRGGVALSLSIPAGGLDVDDAAKDPAAALGINWRDSFLSLEIDRVLPNSAAEAAGLQSGDVLVAIDRHFLEHWSEAVEKIVAAPASTLQIIVWRPEDSAAMLAEGDNGENSAINSENLSETGGGAVTILAVPQAVPNREGQSVGRLGVTPVLLTENWAAMQATLSPGVGEAAAMAARETLDGVRRVFSFLALLASGGLSSDNLAGPVGIAEQGGRAIEASGAAFLHFVALISIALGAANLLPIPVLDGGRIALDLVEIIRRRPLSEKATRAADAIGVAAIIALMIFALLNDITRLFL